jgi:hypothetical protein
MHSARAGMLAEDTVEGIDELRRCVADWRLAPMRDACKNECRGKSREMTEIVEALHVCAS